jgi:hypothetical protein
MLRLIEWLLSERDLERKVRQVCEIKLDYGWKFKGRNKEVSYIDFSCKDLKFRVNGFDVIYDPSEACALLIKEARALEDYFGRKFRFKVSYLGKKYKKFNCQ